MKGHEPVIVGGIHVDLLPAQRPGRCHIRSRVQRWKSAMCRSAPSSPSHQINKSDRLGLSDHSFSSRNSSPMSICAPGAVSNNPLATRCCDTGWARLRAYQDRGLV
jgi:hypothetical protein